MSVITVHRRAARGVAITALALVATACPGDPPVTPPADPAGPTAATVTAITPGGTSFSARPMSADGRWVGYSRYNPDVFYTEPYLFDATTGSSVPLSQIAFGGPNAVDPVVTTDGSAAFYAATQPVAGEMPNYNTELLRYDTATGDLDRFELPGGSSLPTTPKVQDVATSADGSVVALDVSDNSVPFSFRDVMVWTEAGGFETITDHDAISSGDVYGYEVPGAGVSPNGRYTAVVTLDRLDDTGTRQEYLDVYDRTAGTWTRAWTGPVITRPDINEIVTVLAMLDDGSVIFDESTPGNATTFMVGHGVRLWDATTATLSQLVTGDTSAQGWSASPDGRYIGYTGSDQVGSPSNAVFGTPHILDRQTGTILPSGNRPITFPVGIGTGASEVLLFSFDPALNPTPVAGNSLFLWHRP